MKVEHVVWKFGNKMPSVGLIRAQIEFYTMDEMGQYESKYLVVTGAIHYDANSTYDSAKKITFPGGKVEVDTNGVKRIKILAVGEITD